MPLPPWPQFTAFMVASLLLAVTPGPGVIYIITRTALHGRRHGLTSVLAVAAGNLTNAIAAALGLAAVFAASAVAFMIVKYAGAAYLVWLGCRLLSGRPSAQETPSAAITASRVFRDGYLVATLNPKTLLFFAAFLPQFFTTPAHALPQALLLGTLFVAVALVTDTLYALAAGLLAPRLTGATARIGRRAGAGIFIGLGLLAALSGQNHASNTGTSTWTNTP